MEIENVEVESLSFDSDNARLHPEKNRKMLRESLNQFGQRKPIVVTKDDVVVAGNGTLLAAVELGWQTIDIVRIPEDWDADQIRAFAIADNRASDLSMFDMEVLRDQLNELEATDYDLSSLGFDEQSLLELGDIADNATLERLAGRIDGEAYTAKITVPHYEIIGEEPKLAELYDDSRAKELQQAIEIADIPRDVADFLRVATMRHVVFNYRKIAEYYPHASRQIQQLMEESALVIVDADDAIRLGFVKFSQSIDELIAEEENG
jgi:ParB-like chromosome segregation protein Spo0J